MWHDDTIPWIDSSFGELMFSWEVLCVVVGWGYMLHSLPVSRQHGGPGMLDLLGLCLFD